MSLLDGFDYSDNSGSTDFLFSLDKSDNSTSSSGEDFLTTTFIAKLCDLEQGVGNLYQKDVLADKTFKQEGKSDIPDNLVSVLMTKKRGSGEVEFKTKDEHAHLIDQLQSVNIYARDETGKNVVHSLSHRNFTVGTMSDSEYERIHNAAMRSLALLSKQYKEHEEKTETNGSTVLSKHSYRNETGKDEKKLPVGGIFPTNFPRSHPLNPAKTEQLLDEKAADQRAAEKQHVKEKDDAHMHRLDERQITDQLEENILKAAIRAMNLR